MANSSIVALRGDARGDVVIATWALLWIVLPTASTDATRITEIFGQALAYLIVKPGNAALPIRRNRTRKQPAIA